MNGKRRIAIALPSSRHPPPLLRSRTPASASPVSRQESTAARGPGQAADVYHKADMAVEKYNQATSQLQHRAAADQARTSTCSRSPSTTSTSPTSSCSHARREHLQDARRRHRRRPLRLQQLRRPGHPAQPHGAPRQQRRRHRQVHRRLPARHQGPTRQARRRQEGRRQARRRARRAEERGPRPCRASSSR